jgi:hypothetical protein
LSQNCRGSSRKPKTDDIDKANVDELEIFENKIENVAESRRNSSKLVEICRQSPQNVENGTELSNFHRPRMTTSNSLRVAHDDLGIDVDVDEEDFFNPNRVSAKITVDVTVEFERESIYKSKIEETRFQIFFNNGIDAAPK